MRFPLRFEDHSRYLYRMSRTQSNPRSIANLLNSTQARVVRARAVWDAAAKTCLRCGAPIPFEKRENKFCTLTCATSYNNAAKPKRRKKAKACVKCATKFVGRGKGKYCANCAKTPVFYTSMSIGEVRSRALAAGQHPSWLHARVRSFARQWNRQLRGIPCQQCSYRPHIELAHIQPISAFPDATPLGVVNHPENLLALCRNCHWEFDHGLLPVPRPRIELGRLD